MPNLPLNLHSPLSGIVRPLPNIIVLRNCFFILQSTVEMYLSNAITFSVTKRSSSSSRDLWLSPSVSACLMDVA